MLTTVYSQNPKELAAKAAAVLANIIQKHVQQKKEVVIAIPGGRSVQPLWKILASAKNILWKRVHIFMADERVVAIDSIESNYKLAYDMFISSLIADNLLPKENVHPFILQGSIDFGAERYSTELQYYSSHPDIVILGVGEDGHIAALYPNHHSIKNQSTGYIAMLDSLKPPKERVTMSKNTIQKADAALVFFVGDAKREAYMQFLSGSDETVCPVRLVKHIRNVYVFTDIAL